MDIKTIDLCISLLKRREQEILFLINYRRHNEKLSMYERDLRNVRYAIKDLKSK